MPFTYIVTIYDGSLFFSSVAGIEGIDLLFSKSI